MKIDRQSVFDRFSGKCAYCGSILEKGWNLDHAIPKWHCEGKIPIANFNDVHCFENYMPSCRSCNLFKSGNGIEGFRKHIESQIETLRRDRPTFRVAERFGLIECKPQRVVFYFEKFNNKGDS